MSYLFFEKLKTVFSERNKFLTLLSKRLNSLRTDFFFFLADFRISGATWLKVTKSVGSLQFHIIFLNIPNL